MFNWWKKKKKLKEGDPDIPRVPPPPWEITSFHLLADAILELGAYLEEKSISPNIIISFAKRDALYTIHSCAAHLIFQISNIQKDFAEEVIFHGVKQWGIKHKRPLPLLVFDTDPKEMQGIVVVVPMSAMEYKTINMADSAHKILAHPNDMYTLRNELRYQQTHTYNFVCGDSNTVINEMYVLNSPIKRINFNLHVDLSEEKK